LTATGQEQHRDGAGQAEELEARHAKEVERDSGDAGGRNGARV